MSDFQLDARLAADTLFVGDLALARILLMNDARFPWLILVPRRAKLRELHDLSVTDRHHLLDEIGQASDVLNQLCQPHKINIAALGNVVEQLHVHVIARRTDDAAWPRPVWGVGQAVAYASDESTRLIATLRKSLQIVTDPAGS